MTTKIFACLFYFLIWTIVSPVVFYAQDGEIFNLTAESLQNDGKQIELDKIAWKYRAGDDSGWAASDFDDRDWERIEGTNVTPEFMVRPEWKGRAWFRLRVNVDESLVNKNVALILTQRGASEVYIDGRLLVAFGKITDAGTIDYNPNHLPIPFQFERAGEHLIVVRLASNVFSNVSSGAGRWLKDGGIAPGFTLAIRDAQDLGETIGYYANSTAMRGGFLFGGILLALALLHFLLYLFYRVERANLFYSLYAGALAFFILFSNFKLFGHLGTLPAVIIGIVSNLLLAVCFIGLLGFVHVAFGRRLGKVFWAMLVLWISSAALNTIFFNRFEMVRLLPNILIGLSFTFIIYAMSVALREKRSGAWILFSGVQIFALSMFLVLLKQFKVISLSGELQIFTELAQLLSVPLAVSIFLARNFARTNRDLKTQLEQVEQLSLEKIEHERRAAELHAENERRAKELEEARQLQLSMLPKKLPQVNNLEIAAYMKPATEVGGDYYDFHLAADGTLTVAVGDATGHGLKAGSMVTATKSLFNNLAEESDITHIFRRSSAALKKMNFRGLFMAMTILKIKDNNLLMSAAGMPSALIYRAQSGQVEEVLIRAMPLGSVANFAYRQQEFTLSAGDCVLLMSDGFPEMFDESGEMLGYDRAQKILEKAAQNSPQEIISRLIEVSEKWAGTRPPDDDVTFVAIKFKADNNGDL